MYLVPPRPARGFGPTAVTPHELSTLTAIEIMSSGGNAVDGAIAANAVQGVVAPETCGIGGDLFALVHMPDTAKPTGLNASGRAGSGASSSALRSAGHDDVPPFGPESITVPGCVDGWMALSDRFGSLPLAVVLAPAIRYAIGGFPASSELSTSWTHNADRLMSQPSAPSMFPHGRAPERGQMISRPMLAESMAAVADGRDAFYLEHMGAHITKATNGWITEDDLGVDQAEWVDALGLDIFGRTAWTVPPNSQGYLTLATLRIFEMLDPPTDPDDPAYTHALIEAYRSVAGQRDAVTSDPSTAPIAPDELLAIGRLEAHAAQIDMNAAGQFSPSGVGVGGTAYLCTVDAAGMGVSLIQSNFYGIGSGISAGNTGVWLHNRGAGFTLTQGHPNELVPGRRPQHTLSPTIWTENERLALILGTRGGYQQPQLLAQLASHRFHAKEELSTAQARPRWTIEDTAAAESHVAVEGRFDADVLSDLGQRGHLLEPTDAWVGGWGPISAIEIDRHGLRTAAADPRVDTALALAT